MAKLLLFTAVLGAVSVSLTATAQPARYKCPRNELAWRVRSLPGEVSTTLVIAEYAEPQSITLCRTNEPGISAGLQVLVLSGLQGKDHWLVTHDWLDEDQCMNFTAMSVQVMAIKQGDQIKDEAAASGQLCE